MRYGTEAAAAAINLHTEQSKIDDEGNPEIALYHLLDSLSDYAEDHGVDLGAVLADVVEDRRVNTANPAIRG